MKHALRYLNYFKKELIMGPAFKLVEAIFELIVPIVMARIIDIGITANDMGYILRMGALMIALAAAGFCFTLVCQYSASRASQGYGTRMRHDMFCHIQSLSPRQLDALGAPSLVTRLTNDINQLQLAVAMLIRLVVRAPFLVIGATVMAMCIDWKLSLIFICAGALVALTLYLVTSRAAPLYRSIQKRLDTVSGITRETLSGVRVIRAFSRQPFEKARFDAANAALFSESVRVGRISAFLNPVTYLVLNLAIVLIVWAGGFRVYGGALSTGEIIALVNYMTQIFLAITVVANLVVIFTRAAACAVRVGEVFDIKGDIEPGTLDRAKAADSGEVVRFSSVCFSYGGGENALENVSFSVGRGETVGIIGGTGSGKTTLISLIARFYDVTGGCVYVDGVDVRDYSFDALRSRLGLVLQQAVLFRGTVLDNMRLGCAQADEETVWQALSVAQASDFVTQMGGLQAQIEQDGRNLSGGQRQRLTIARALVRRPELLILDDSSSALDFATDAALRKALKQAAGGMSVITVSQRVGAVKHADRIVVLDDGQVAGIGTHAQLYQGCEVYRQICLSQLSEQEAAK